MENQEQSLDQSPPQNSFEQFGISAELLQSLTEMGFVQPTEIQTKTIPILLKQNTDIVALAQTGTGKTGAFGIPLVEKIDASEASTQVLVLSPTRELCQQVSLSLQAMGKGKGVKVLSIYGGDSYSRQMQGLRARPHVLVCTPGRLMDMMERGLVQTKSIRILVLDEADEMISMGFRDALDTILGTLSKENLQTWLFSATMSPEIQRIQGKYIQNPQRIEARNQKSEPRISQEFIVLDDRDRIPALVRYLQIHDDFYGLIFCQTKKEVSDLERSLSFAGLSVASLHGDKSQKDRESVLNAWKKKHVKVVVATDVAARGLDITGLSHVINFSLPFEVEAYVHRIGRTGRNQAEGVALSLVSPKRMSALRRLEKALKVKLKEAQIPTATQVQEKIVCREWKKLTQVKVQADQLEQMQKWLARDSEFASAGVGQQDFGMLARLILLRNPDLFRNQNDIRQLKGAASEVREHREDRGAESRSWSDRRGGAGGRSSGRFSSRSSGRSSGGPSRYSSGGSSGESSGRFSGRSTERSFDSSEPRSEDRPQRGPKTNAPRYASSSEKPSWQSRSKTDDRRGRDSAGPRRERPKFQEGSSIRDSFRKGPSASRSVGR